jgi:hypothetical protein
MKTSGKKRTAAYRGPSPEEISRHVNRAVDERLSIAGRRITEATAETAMETRTTRNEARVTQGVLLGEMHTDIDNLEKALSALWDRLTPVTAQMPKAESPGGPTTATPIQPLALSSHAQGVQHATYRLRHIASQVQNLTGLLEV